MQRPLVQATSCHFAWQFLIFNMQFLHYCKLTGSGQILKRKQELHKLFCLCTMTHLQHLFCFKNQKGNKKTTHFVYSTHVVIDHCTQYSIRHQIWPGYTYVNGILPCRRSGVFLSLLEGEFHTKICRKFEINRTGINQIREYLNCQMRRQLSHRWPVSESCPTSTWSTGFEQPKSYPATIQTTRQRPITLTQHFSGL